MIKNPVLHSFVFSKIILFKKSERETVKIEKNVCWLTFRFVRRVVLVKYSTKVPHQCKIWAKFCGTIIHQISTKNEPYKPCCRAYVPALKFTNFS